MENEKKKSILIAIAGLLILLLSVFLDDIGIGRTPGFGLAQIAGTIAGAVIMIYGIVKAIKNTPN